jgi:hypothetical protein
LKNGVPFSVVFDECYSLYPHELMAMSVVFSEFEGNEFDWQAMQFKKKE